MRTILLCILTLALSACQASEQREEHPAPPAQAEEAKPDKAAKSDEEAKPDEEVEPYVIEKLGQTEFLKRLKAMPAETKELTIRVCQIESLDTGGIVFPKVRKLELTDCFHGETKMMSSVPKGAPEDLSQLAPAGYLKGLWEELIVVFPNIDSLKVDNQYDPQFTHARLYPEIINPYSWCRDLVDSQVFPLVCTIPLKELCLHGQNLLGMEDLKKLAPTLEVLDLRYVGGLLTNSLVATLPSCVNLRELYAYGEIRREVLKIRDLLPQDLRINPRAKAE